MKIVLYIYGILLFIFGIIFFINGIVVYKKEGKTFSHILPSIFGLEFICISILIYYTINVDNKLIYFFILLMSYVPLLLLLIIIYSNIYNLLYKNNDPDFIIVLGCKIRKNGTVMPLLKSRLDIAINRYKYLKSKPLFVVCGGKGDDEPITEALAMKNYLLEQGISKDKIILEDKSINTLENLQFAKEKMDKISKNYKCLVATSKYHLIRTLELCKEIDLNAIGIGSKTTLYFYPSALSREVVAYSLRHMIIVICYIIFVLIISFI